MLKLYAMTRVGRAVPVSIDAVVAGAMPLSRWALRTHIKGGSLVSTSFVPIDLDLETTDEEKSEPDYRPMVFETGVFYASNFSVKRRYRSIVDAIKGHNEVVAELDAASSWIGKLPASLRKVRARCSATRARIDKLEFEIARLTGERDMWKTNHDNQVALKRALLDRPDLGDRAKSIENLTTALAEAKAESEVLRKTLVWVRSFIRCHRVPADHVSPTGISRYAAENAEVEINNTLASIGNDAAKPADDL